MAQINIERRSSATWLWWLIGLIVLALVIWALIAWGSHRTTNVAAAPTPPPVAAPETSAMAPPAAVPGEPATAGAVPVAEILSDPSAWTGRTVSGEVQVTQVVSDRGFWAEDQGKKVFVVLNEHPVEIKNINAGQRIRLNGATVYDRGDLDQVPGTLEPEAQKIAQGQPAILAIDSLKVDILTTGLS